MLVTQMGRPRAASSQPSAATADPGHDGGTKDGMSKPPAEVTVLGKTLELEHGGGARLHQAGRCAGL